MKHLTNLTLSTLDLFDLGFRNLNHHVFPRLRRVEFELSLIDDRILDNPLHNNFHPHGRRDIVVLD